MTEQQTKAGTQTGACLYADMPYQNIKKQLSISRKLPMKITQKL